MNARIAALALVAGLVPSLHAAMAHATTLYSVDRSLACINGCTGNATVSGTLTVDTLGTLAASDFTDWTLTFSTSGRPDTVLTPANSSILLEGSGGSVVADASGLTITQPGASGDPFSFGVLDNEPFPFIVGWQFFGGDGTRASELATNAPGSGPTDQGEFVAESGPLVVTLPAVATTPIPGTALLFGTGLAGLGLLAFGRARARRAAAPGGLATAA